MNVVSLGLGTNSTAILVGMRDRGIKPDLILFSDTGGERDHTYAYIPILNKWLENNGMPQITQVRVSGELLEENCLRRRALPSVAYGFKSCSIRWKIEPQEKFLNNDERAKSQWNKGLKVTKIIGIDMDESHRARQPTDKQAKKYINAFPLLEWGWGREDCIRAIRDAGLPQPYKSSCFFCPNMTPTEIRQLNDLEPDKMQRAIAMEKNADLTNIAGLGRNWKWSNLIATDDMYGFSGTGGDDCMNCYDG